MTYKDNLVLSNKKAVVACDLFLSLRLYHLPEWLQERLKIAFPNVKIVPVNTPDTQLTIEDATVYWGNRITSKIIKSMPRLEWIHFGSVGVNRVNADEVSKRSLLITSSKGLVVSSMVASATAFMTNLARGIHYSQMLRNQGNMNRDSFDNYFDQIHELSSERCLIVGFGDVGNRLVKVCKALEMNVSVISRSIKKHDSVDEFFTLEQISDAVSNADYIVNLLPLNVDTEQVFTRQVFNKMKNSAFFINIGRGETVDEKALISALENKKIAGAGLDVFAQEPLSKSSPLWNMESVILSPHVAGLSNGYWDRQADLFMNNLKYYLEGNKKFMRNLVDMQKNY
jgi:phosphoglycerate dehydrogenase-like enzyme